LNVGTGMDDVVPGVLQRLREADIVGMAGLAGASLGQEYYRRGFISLMKRQGIRLSGVVTLPAAFSEVEGEQEASQASEGEPAESAPRHFELVVEVVSTTVCEVVCRCGKQAAVICPHAAALLYQWIHRPLSFIALPPLPGTEAVVTMPGGPRERTAVPKSQKTQGTSSLHTAFPSRFSTATALLRRRSEVSTVSETLAQFGLSELRALAREYGIELAGLSKQQLLETLIETLCQPEAVRRVVKTLEKPPRQLLAAFALAGGSMSDEELRELFERFALSKSGPLQDMLLALQAKLLIVRTSFNHSLPQRFNLSLAPLDLSWYIPREIYEALHITLPVTPFDVSVPSGKGLPVQRLAAKDRLLADLLLIARALDGSPVEQEEKRARGSLLNGGHSSTDGSLALPPPADQPAPALIETLNALLGRPPAFLRFAVRLLRQAGIVSPDEDWGTKLQARPEAARLLLGPTRDDTLHNLFTRWAAQASYAELAELAENGLRVRCRATPLNQPDLRRGELEQENSEARQDVLALLARVPVGEWINFSAFARFLYRLRPTFLQSRQHLFPSPHWWIEQEEGHPLHPDRSADWLKAEGRYLAHLIQGPLHWWGLCDIALTANEHLLAFRLTPLARSLLQGQRASGREIAPQRSAEREPAFSVSADGHLLVDCQPDNWPLLACIEVFAESKGVRDSKLLYRLTAHSLSQAIGQGHDPRELLSLLDSASSAGEEQALRALLASMERRIASYGRVRLYTDVSLLQTADSAIMQHLNAITSLERQVVRSIQPTLLLLKKQGIERLLEELKRRGQTPLLHEEG